jgi:hypothetical protein
MKPVGLIRLYQSFQHLQTIANTLTSFCVAKTARLVKHSNFLNRWYDVDTISNSRINGFEMVMLR